MGPCSTLARSLWARSSRHPDTFGQAGTSRHPVHLKPHPEGRLDHAQVRRAPRHHSSRIGPNRAEVTALIVCSLLRQANKQLNKQTTSKTQQLSLQLSHFQLPLRACRGHHRHPGPETQVPSLHDRGSQNTCTAKPSCEPPSSFEPVAHEPEAVRHHRRTWDRLRSTRRR
jgi:hypothetical protein